jgi:adenosylcobinamide-GDP ribazoletransferase
MKDFMYAIVIAVSFFTIIPLPMVRWTERRLKFLPLLIPLVGLGIGTIGYGLYLILITTTLSDFTSAVCMVLFYLTITGGIHMDGLMDTADAYFSRRSKTEKLEIMKDSRVGAFAVMALVSLVLLKTAFCFEIFFKGKETAILLVFIPVLSRIVQALMLCLFPYAKKDGLANMFSQASGARTITILVFYFMLAIGLVYLLLGIKALILPLGLLLFTIFYYFSTKKNFGGITGDIVGAFLELAEVLMLGILMAL